MKVVLLQHVEKVGRAGDVRDVSNGFFRNLLAPRGLAKIATAQTIREAEAAKARVKAAEAQEKAAHAALAASLAEQGFTLSRKATAEGHLFGSVSAHDIASHLQEQGVKAVREEHIALEASIKTIGVHTVPLRFGDDISSEVILTIEPDA